MHFTFSSVVPSFQGMSVLIANGCFFGKQHSLVLLEKLFFSLTKIQQSIPKNRTSGLKRVSISSSLFFFLKSIYLFLAALGLHRCARAFSSYCERGLLFVAVCRLFTAVATHCRAGALGTWASVVVAHGLSCSVACGIFPDQGSNPCPLHWQVDS